MTNFTVSKFCEQPFCMQLQNERSSINSTSLLLSVRKKSLLMSHSFPVGKGFMISCVLQDVKDVSTVFRSALYPLITVEGEIEFFSCAARFRNKIYSPSTVQCSTAQTKIRYFGHHKAIYWLFLKSKSHTRSRRL